MVKKKTLVQIVTQQVWIQNHVVEQETFYQTAITLKGVLYQKEQRDIFVWVNIEKG